MWPYHFASLHDSMLRSLPLPEKLSGKLWLTAMPGRFEPFQSFLSEARRCGVTEMVCLVGDMEIAHYAPEYAAALEQGTIPFPVSRFPIPDFGVPEDVPALVQLGREVVEKLRRGGHLVVHCAAGHGRTGFFAVMVLFLAGVPVKEALRTVQQSGSNPETESQIRLLAKISSVHELQT